MQKFVDLRMSAPSIDALWRTDADGRAQSPLDAINDEHWSEAWMADNDEDFGNPSIARADSEDGDAPLAPEAP